MELTLTAFLVVCPFLFLAGVVDAIGGGGGLISLPAYLIAGLPPHMAMGTNKLSACCGTTLATLRFVKNGLVNFRLALPTVLAALLGATLGTKVNLILDEKILLYGMLVVLPVCFFVVFRKDLFRESQEINQEITSRTYIVTTLCSLVIGFYDGFYGPGTGTFLIMAYTVFGKLDIRNANGQAKIVNLASGVGSVAVFISGGQVLYTLGLVGAVCNMLGGYIGAGLVMKNGAKIVRPSIFLVLILLGLKLLGVF